jgi:hypothetical protein
VIDWTHGVSALVGAAVVALAVWRWRTRDRSRDITITVDWHSKARDDSTSTKADEP